MDGLDVAVLLFGTLGSLVIIAAIWHVLHSLLGV